jgi:hypothetical protein
MPQITYEEAIKLPRFYAIAWLEEDNMHRMNFSDKETADSTGLELQRAGKHMQAACSLNCERCGICHGPVFH